MAHDHDLELVGEIQRAIRGAFHRHAVAAHIRLMSTFSALAEVCCWIDAGCAEPERRKLRQDMGRMADRLRELAQTEDGAMSLFQIRTADEIVEMQ